MTLSVNGVSVVQGRLTIPRWGIWWADLTLSEPTKLSGKVSIKEREAELVGTVVSGSPNGARASYRIVGGAGGWRKKVPEKGYQNAAGCTFSSVANELAAETGETLDSPPRKQLGPHYTRLSGAASETLNQHFPRAWHIGDDGKTRFTARPKLGAYKDDSAAVEEPNDLGIIRVSADYADTIRPGITVNGTLIGDVDLFYTPKNVAAYCYPDGGAALDAVGQIVDRVVAKVRFMGCYEYTVGAVDGAYLLDVEPVEKDLGLPNLDKVRIRPPSGYKSKPEPNSTVVMMFLNGNPGRPIVMGAAESDENDSSLVILGTDSGSDFVALAKKVDDMGAANKQFTADVVSWAGSHTHAGTTACGAGPGTCATTTVLPAIGTAVIAPTLQSVAASNVKAS